MSLLGLLCGAQVPGGAPPRTLDGMREASTAIGQTVVLTGWGSTVTPWTVHITRHAVEAEQAARMFAVCGAALFDLNSSRTWRAEDPDDTDACRSCMEVMTSVISIERAGGTP